MTQTLDAALLAAHEKDDRDALIRLYKEAAEASESPQQRAFFLTHAFVFALEAGDARAEPLRAALVEIGSELPL